MALMTPIWTGLRAVWGTLLYIWLQGAWALLVAVGLIQMVWAVLVAVGLLVPTDRVDGDGWGVIVLVIAILNGIAYWCSHHVALMPRTRQITEDRNPKPESTEGRSWGQPLKKPEGAPLNLG